MEQGRREPPKEPVYISAVGSAFKFGAACGSIGFLFGGASGVILGAPGFLSASASGIRAFAIGTSFSLFRTTIVHAWTPEGQITKPRDLVKASALAGGISGGVVGLLLRGRSNGIPGAIVFTIAGSGGQYAYNRWTAPKELIALPKTNFWKRISEKAWMPFRVLSNDEYAEMLRERVLKLDVEIALLDDKIVGLKEQQVQEEAAAAQDVERANQQQTETS